MIGLIDGEINFVGLFIVLVLDLYTYFGFYRLNIHPLFYLWCSWANFVLVSVFHVFLTVV